MDTTPTRKPRDPSDDDHHWTPRQKEVLDLIARGKSNQEIADTLGISLDGAKWHMREILSKLDVATREEAADYWRRRHGLAPRLARTWRAITAATAGKWALVGATTVAALAISTLVAALALNNDDDPSSGDQPEASQTPATATVSASSATTPPSGTPRAISGLFETPGELRSDFVRSLAPATSPFPPWDGKSTVIYDTVTNELIELGPGTNVSWSPDGTRAAWVSGDGPNILFDGGIAKVIDVRDRSQHDLGPARYASFTDDRHVLLAKPQSNDGVLVDLVTGESSPATLPRFPAEPQAAYLTIVENVGPPLERGLPGSHVWELRVTATEERILRFTASDARLATEEHILVATTAAGDLSNLFLVEVATGQAQYIATVRISSNWPLSASDRWVVWTDGYCDIENPGQVRIYDRRSGKVTALDDGLTEWEAIHNARYMKLTANDLLQVGTFNGGTLLDPETLEHRAVIPGTHVSWSPDFRYGAHGQFGGHGGLC